MLCPDAQRRKFGQWLFGSRNRQRRSTVPAVAHTRRVGELTAAARRGEAVGVEAEAHEDRSLWALQSRYTVAHGGLRFDGSSA
jgi:hypothetical protein